MLIQCFTILLAFGLVCARNSFCTRTICVNEFSTSVTNYYIYTRFQIISQVKYYNAESYEVKKFETAILDYQDSEYKTGFSLVFLNMSQATIINLGLLAGSLLCAKFVLDDKFNVSNLNCL